MLNKRLMLALQLNSKITSVPHFTYEDVLPAKICAKQMVAYFCKYGYGGHKEIKCKSFNVPLIRFQIKFQISLSNFDKKMSCKNAIFFKTKLLGEILIFI